MLLIDRDLLLQVQGPPSQTCESKNLSVSNVQSLVFVPWHTRLHEAPVIFPAVSPAAVPSSGTPLPLEHPLEEALLIPIPKSWSWTPLTLRFMVLDQSMEILTLLSEMGKPEWLVGKGQCPGKGNGRFDWQKYFHEDVTQDLEFKNSVCVFSAPIITYESAFVGRT